MKVEFGLIICSIAIFSLLLQIITESVKWNQHVIQIVICVDGSFLSTINETIVDCRLDGKQCLNNQCMEQQMIA